MNSLQQLNKGRDRFIYNIRKKYRQGLLNQKRGQRCFTLSNNRSYLHNFPLATQSLILLSLTNPIPHPLPALHLQTISYYRRSGHPLYVQNYSDNPHTLFEFLCMLAMHELEKFENPLQIITKFEMELEGYLGSQYQEIRAIAMMVAGNRALGYPETIRKIKQRENMWVVVNHVVERKVGLECVFQGIVEGVAECFWCLCEMAQEQETFQKLMREENRKYLEVVVTGMGEEDNGEMCLKIVGTLASQRHQQRIRGMMAVGGFLDILMMRLDDRQQLRCLVCWILSNIVADSQPLSLSLLTPLQSTPSSPLLAKLLHLLRTDTRRVQRQLLFFFNNLFCSLDSQSIRNLSELLCDSLVEVMARCEEEESAMLMVQIMTRILKAWREVEEGRDGRFQEEGLGYYGVVGVVKEEWVRKRVEAMTYRFWGQGFIGAAELYLEMTE